MEGSFGKEEMGREHISFFLVLYGIISMKVKTAILLGKNCHIDRTGRVKIIHQARSPRWGREDPPIEDAVMTASPTAAFSCEDPAASLHW